MKTFGPATANTRATRPSQARSATRSAAGGLTAASRTRTSASGGKKKGACPWAKPIGTSEG